MNVDLLVNRAREDQLDWQDPLDQRENGVPLAKPASRAHKAVPAVKVDHHLLSQQFYDH